MDINHNSTELMDFEDYFDRIEAAGSSVTFAIFKALIMLTLIMATLFGNALVIISVYRSPRLRIIANSFIASLAIADFMMAVLVMPFSASVNISGIWYFGSVACDIFNANDVLFSTASLLQLCCISVDRYVAILRPLRYPSWMTQRKVLWMLSCAWGASVLISHGPIHMGWYTTQENTQYRRTAIYSCTFQVNQIYAIISCTISFWAPTIVIIVAYVKIFREARRQENEIYSLSYSVGKCMGAGLSHVKYLAVPSKDAVMLVEENSRNSRQTRRKMRSEHKAAKTLGVVLSAFLMCWLPFFIWYLTTSLCTESCYTPPDLVSALFWIGYSNSALNPLIYAYFNRDFRKSFAQMLGCSHLERNAIR